MRNILIAVSAAIALSIARAQNPSPSPVASPAVVEAERVTVSGGEIEKSETDTTQSVVVLNENELKTATAPTLGDTLSAQPGVAASGFTGGASRPIIRGQSDNRVRVLNNGTEVFDVSNLSPDHAPSVSTLLSQSIEIVRGPATILYGSGAIGGVVNVTDNLIPVEQPSEPISGEVDARFDRVDLERSGAMRLTISPAKHWVFTAEGSWVKTDDRTIPGFALDQRIRAELTPPQKHNEDFGGDPSGEVPNTFLETKDFGAGASYVWDKGYVGFSYSRFLSDYGVPDDPEADDPAMPPEKVTLDVRKDQYNARSSIVDPFAGISVANAKFVYTDYRHTELDDGDVGATFKTRGVDSRLELVHQPIGIVQGSIGSQILYKELSILGDEAFLQPTTTLALAGFVFEEVKLSRLRLQFGARVEHDKIDIDSSDPALTSLTSPNQSSREFWPLSAATGAICDFAGGWQLALNLAWSERAPAAEELFARGPHDATFQFIIGDPTLDLETNRTVDLGVRKTAGRITGFVSGFYTNYDDYIDFAPTGDFDDGLRVFVYTPKPAEFYGGEARVDYHFLPLGLTKTDDVADDKSVRNLIAKPDETAPKNPNDLFLRLQSDYVHAEDIDTGAALPRITPLRFTASLNYESEHWDATLEGQRVQRQFRTAPFETSTPGYTLLNVSAGYKFQWGRTYNFVYLKGTNLTDEEARDHVSFLKEVMPLPGRGLVIGFRTMF